LRQLHFLRALDESSPSVPGQIREAQCGRRLKINWTKTAHRTHTHLQTRGKIFRATIIPCCSGKKFSAFRCVASVKLHLTNTTDRTDTTDMWHA